MAIDAREYYDAMFQLLGDYIHQSRDDNEVRFEYWKMMSNRDWKNKDFDELVWGACNLFAVAMMRADRRTSEKDVALDVAQEWVKYDLANLIVENREWGNMVDNDMYDKARQLNRERESLIRDVNRTLEEEDRRSSSRDRGRGNDRDYDRSTRDDRSRNAGRSDGGQRPGERFANNRGGNGGSGTMRRSGIAAVASAVDNRREEPKEREREQSREREPVRDHGRRYQQEEARPEPARSDRYSMPKLDGPDFTLARPYDEYVEDGEIWRPAHLSGWTVSWDEKHPFETAFNPEKQMRFHVKGTDGKVREEFLDMTREMDYLRHETRVQKQGQNPRQREVNDYAGVGEGSAPPAEMPTESARVVAASRMPIRDVYDQVLTGDSMEAAEVFAQFKGSLLGTGINVHNYAVVRPIPTDLKRYPAIEGLTSATNLTDLAERMQAAYEQADGAIWDFLDERFRFAVQKVARNVFGIKVTFDNFTGSYKGFIDYLKKKKGEAFARDFSKRTAELVPVLTEHMDEDSARMYLTGALDITDEEFNLNRPNILCFRDYYTVAAVPFTTHDLEVKLEADSQAVSKERQPALHGLLTRLFNEKVKDFTGPTVYLLTTDRVRVEVIRAPHDDDMFLIRKL